MKRIYSIFVCLVFVIASMSAQEGMSVKSFVEIPTDLDARVTYPVQDPNAKKCALVKIVTTEDGFTFDNGVLCVTKAIHKPELSEWWVYLPEKTIKLKIMHPVYGQLTDSEDGYFYFPNQLKSATCYRMVLTTQRKVVTYEPTKIETGFFILKTNPDKAQVYITENGVENFAGETPFQKKLPYGTYKYRIKKSLYHDEVGIAKVDSIRVVQDISLRPAFGSLKITSTPSGATVTINNDNKTYTTPCEIPYLEPGDYVVDIVKSQYSSHQQKVTIIEEQTTPLNAILEERFALVTINTLPNAKVIINGELRGIGNFSCNLEEGIYDIEVSLAQHRSKTRQIEVVAKQPQTLTVNPTPICGSLDVITTPMDANITINGKNYGTTPTTIKDLLIGEYDVVLSKDGCATETRRVTITESNLSTIEATLAQGREMTIRSDAQGDEVYIDGEIQGETPLTTSLSFGTHSIVLHRGEMKLGRQVNVKTTDAETAINFEFDPQMQSSSATINSSKKAKKEPFVRVGIEGSIEGLKSFSTGWGLSMRIGRFNSLFNSTIGIKYQYTGYSKWVGYSYDDYNSYWGYEYVYSYADYKRKVNQFVFPIILNWNAARNDNWSFYLGIGYEFGVLLSDNYKFEYDFGDPFNESDFYRYGDEDFVQLSVPSRSVILQMGFAGRHWDWKAYYKINTNIVDKFNGETGAIGTAFTYYF